MYCLSYIHFLTLCLPYQAIEVFEYHGVCTSWCQNKISMFLEFSKTDRVDLFCQIPRWSRSRQCENMFMSVQDCFITCIAYYTDTVDIMSATQGHTKLWNIGVCTGCCQNKITMLLDFPKTDRLNLICQGSRWSRHTRPYEDMKMLVSAQVVAKIKSQCFSTFPRQTDSI